MNTKEAVWAALLAFVIAFSSIVPSFAEPPVGNLVGAELTRGNWYFTNGDSVSNSPLTWNSWVFADIYKWPDGGSPVVNPAIQLSTKLGLTGFQPTDANDPALTFEAHENLGLYTWSLAGQINPSAHMSVSAVEGTATSTPRFSASRTVEPEILADVTTRQTVTVNLKVEEALPPDTFNLSVVIGVPNFAYKTFQLVSTQFVSQTEVADWQSRPGPTSASWSIDPSRVQVGKLYVFQATLESVKSDKLVGAPVYKPQASVFYSDQKNFGVVNGTSVEISDPAGVVGARFSADNIVNWTAFARSFRWNVIFNAVVSQVTGSEPPFRVLIPADVRTDPETIELGSKGTVTAFIKLPPPYRVQDIDASSVTLQLAPATRWVIANDTLIVKFDTEQLQHISPGQQVELRMQGQFTDGSIFRGKDVVQVLP